MFDLAILSFCVNNELSQTGTGLDTQTYFVGESPLQLAPKYGISTTVSQIKCPLTHSYYLKNASGSWVL